MRSHSLIACLLCTIASGVPARGAEDLLQPAGAIVIEPSAVAIKLSLRGADPEPDYFAITKDAFVRRINPLAPLASALIAKPRGDASHEGGIRFPRGSLSDDLLARWVEQGAPGDLADPAQVVSVR